MHNITFNEAVGATSVMQFSSPSLKLAMVGAHYFRDAPFANDWEPVCWWRLKEFKTQKVKMQVLTKSFF